MNDQLGNFNPTRPNRTNTISFAIERQSGNLIINSREFNNERVLVALQPPPQTTLETNELARDGHIFDGPYHRKQSKRDYLQRIEGYQLE